DTLRSILIDVYKAREEDLPSLYRRFRQENPSIADPDYLPTGTKITVPLTGEAKTDQAAPKKPQPQTIQELQVKQVATNEYVIKQGEYLAKILRRVYGVSDDLIFHKYLDLVKQLNPEISDPNLIQAGQKLRLPDVKQVLTAAQRSNYTSVPPVSVTTAGEQTENKQVETRIALKHNKKDQVAKESETVSQPRQTPQAPVSTQTVSSQAAEDLDMPDLRKVKGNVMPALKTIGGKQRDKGSYFMPVTGGTNLSIDTSEVPVMELDTGKKIIFDLNEQITPEMKRFIEKAFPSFTVISGSQGDMEALMDKVLSVSGYFSINKNGSPLLVGSEEKLRFFGKWIVYKDFSRSNVFVVNLLKDEDMKTPSSIRSYAGHFGIDLIEVGGKDVKNIQKKLPQVVDLKHSYQALLKRLEIPYSTNKEIDLLTSGVVKISYKAPILVGKVILTDTVPAQDMAGLLQQHSYELIDTNTAQLEDVLKAIGLEFEKPPLKMIVAQGRTELEIPGLSLGSHVILLRKIDKDISAYLAASGRKVLAW
ncbi:MAG TPA: LysM peptidoglycan-binding domain-containing protein, partial [Desulfomonilia bacterium]|nr:LysM peptidoglycan-binding domain-containing protein [Desulfomonilia bacterium]